MYNDLLGIFYFMEKEIWKDIPEYEGIYQVSNLGRVKSLSRKVKNRKSYFYTKELILKQDIKKGYFVVILTKERIRKNYSVHQLVSMAFLNHKPCGFQKTVDHINEIKTDNRVENLQILTNRENVVKFNKNKGYKFTGTTFDKSRNKWSSKIVFKGRTVHLGRFLTQEEASKAYQNKLKEIENG